MAFWQFANPDSQDSKKNYYFSTQLAAGKERRGSVVGLEFNQGKQNVALCSADPKATTGFQGVLKP